MIKITGKCQTCSKVFLLSDSLVWENIGKKCILCELPVDKLGRLSDETIKKYELVWFPRLMRQND